MVPQASVNPASAASLVERPALTSSRILSKINTFASTAIPMVRIIPAMPGRVKVAPIKLNAPSIRNRLVKTVTVVNTPNRPYAATINKTTAIRPIMEATMPSRIESEPKPAPTVLSSRTSNGAGKAPERSSKARSLADLTVKLPLIMPLPPKIAL